MTAADTGDLIAAMPFARQLGITLAQVGPDRVVAELAWAPDLCTSTGVMHGGALMSLADSAGALVTVLSLAQGQTTATLTSTTQFFRPVTGGTVRAVAVPLNKGRTTMTVQTSLYTAEGKLVAHVTQIQAIR